MRGSEQIDGDGVQASGPEQSSEIVEGRYGPVGDEVIRNLTQSTMETLGRAIITGRYDNRVFPTEAEIARVYSVSRSVTREAVKMLTAKGLVSARRRYGTTVSPVSHWNLFDTDVLRWTLDRKFSVDLLRHFSQLRLGIEPQAAALAAAFRDDADILAIRAGLADMEAAERGTGDPLTADIAFHVAVLLASKNPFFAQFKSVVETALRTSIRFTNTVKGRTANIPEHAGVAEAIVNGDADRAHRAMAAIIVDVLDVIKTHHG